MKALLHNLGHAAARLRRGVYVFGQTLPAAPPSDPRPDWQQADPAWMRRALARSQALPGGGWYVLDATRSFGAAPRRVSLLGRELVVWRAGTQLMAALDACPHLGAALSAGRVCDGKLVCPWHGLALGPEAEPSFAPLPTHDDGYLLWVRVDNGEAVTERPHLALRPERGIDAVIRVEAECEPKDVIANRLDPWHGAHYHAHSFGRLRVIDQREDAITVRVAYRVAGPLSVEVDARFHCPDPRTIVMTIVNGEGEGSVVETHATPLTAGRAAVVELTLASSERFGFAVARRASWLLRPGMAWAARRLWHDDALYAERLYWLRKSKLVKADTLQPKAATPGKAARRRPGSA
jgi:phenylpropionate dioxygenase-like ring-hydroxylating dioxygenase large terminal subunit